jgi:hypothetical protein
VPLHCTGEPFYEIAKAEMPTKLLRSYTGRRFAPVRTETACVIAARSSASIRPVSTPAKTPGTCHSAAPSMISRRTGPRPVRIAVGQPHHA